MVKIYFLLFFQIPTQKIFKYYIKKIVKDLQKINLNDKKPVQNKTYAISERMH